MKALNLSAVICSLPVTIQKSENPSQNFQENNDCSMGHKFKNNSFNGLYKDLIDQDADFILFFAKHELLYEDFFYSSINILEEIIFFYFFHVKSNNLSILSNIKKISYDIRFLNVLLIEFDKTNYLLTLEDLSLSSYYNPIIISKDIEDLFENSKLISKKVIWNKFKKTTLHPSCSYDATFTGQLECLNFMKNNNLALITEDKEIPFFENVYCADNNKLINKNDNYVWVYGKPFLTYSNYFPINKKIKLYKRKIFDKHVSSLFNMGRFIKLNIDVAKNLKVLFISKNSEYLAMQALNLTTVICSLPVTIQRSKDENKNFDGILASVFNDFFPRKKFNLNSYENTDCLLGHKFENNGTFNGMYDDLLKQNLDFILFCAKHQLLYDEFSYSPIIYDEKIVYFYFFLIKSNSLSILSNMKKVSSDILVLVLIVYIINLSFELIKKKSYNKVYKLLSTVFISFFLTNYILGYLNVLLIEFDKTNFIPTLEDLSLSSYYNPIIYSQDIEDLFEKSNEKTKKIIWQKYKKTNREPCNYDADFEEELKCLQYLKVNKIAIIFEEGEIPFFEPVYCSDDNHLVNRNDNYVWIYGEPFLRVSNFYPYNKKISFHKRKILDDHLVLQFDTGLSLKQGMNIKKSIKDQFRSKNSECILTKKNEFINSYENTDCLLGHKFENNGTYNGMYNDLLKQDLDFIMFSAKHQLLYDDFLYSPIIYDEKIVYFYFFLIKSNNLSIMSNIKKISSEILVLATIVYLTNLSFDLVKKVSYNKVYKLLSTVFISFFLINYILGSLNVLLIELDKTNYISSLKDLALSSYYSPIIYTEDTENLFENSDEKVKKKIWKKYKNIKRDTSCNYDADFEEEIRCLQSIKSNKLAMIIEEGEIPFFEPVYCAENNRLIDKNDNYVWIYSQPFLQISNYFPFNKKISFLKRKKLYGHLNLLFNMGLLIKQYRDLNKSIKDQFKSRNSECILTKKRELFDKNLFFTQLLPVVLQKTKDENLNFGGILAPVYNSLFPRKKLFFYTHENTDCLLGHRFDNNGTYNGMYNDLLEKNLDLIFFCAKHQLLYDDFLYRYLNVLLIEFDKTNYVPTLKDLSSSSFYKPIIYSQDIQVLFKNSEETTKKLIWKKFKKIKLDPSCKYDADFEDELKCLKFMKTNKFAIILEEGEIPFFEPVYCANKNKFLEKHDKIAWVYGKPFSAFSNFFPYNKNLNSHKRKILDDHMNFLFNMGLFIKQNIDIHKNIKNQFKTKNSECVLRKKEELLDKSYFFTQLVFDNYQSLFIIFIFIQSLTILLFFLDFLLFFIKKNENNFDFISKM
uniref:Ligated ion channel binding I - glutamate n=1 Tax=Polyphagotarsonemus latus TaxID=1204166 RepID=A0AAN0LHK4_9ACAR